MHVPHQRAVLYARSDWLLKLLISVHPKEQQNGFSALVWGRFLY